jgi:plasmid stability protein
MRTTLDLPDALLRQLKARAALEGTSLKTLMRSVVERGLQAPADPAPTSSARAAALPSIRLGRPLNLEHPSNAALFELLDE